MISNCIVGVDPGRYGALVALPPEGRTPLAILPMPLLPDELIDWAAVSLFLNSNSPSVTVIEKVHSRPGQGVKGTFTFGGMLEGLKALCQSMRLPYELVAPQTWQAEMLRDMDRTDTKAASVEYCSRAFPGAVPRMTRTKWHDGVADALCLAEFGRRHFLSSSRP